MTSASDARPGSSSSDILEIDPTFASGLGLDQKQKVTIVIHADPPQAHTVHLDPVTNSDWEIVETHAEFLESWMINQVRAVSKLHTITVYPSPTSVATLAVVKIEPEPAGGFAFAQLSPNSEVIIAPKVAKKEKEQSKLIGGNNSAASGTHSGGKQSGRAAPNVLLRGVSLPHPSYSDLNAASQKYTMEVYADPDSVLYPLRGAEYVSVSVITPTGVQSGNANQNTVPGVNSTAANTANNGTGSNVTGANSATTAALGEDTNDIPSATSVVAKLVSYRNGPHGHVGLSYALSVALGISDSVGNVIRLEPAQKPLSKAPSKLSIRPIVTVSAPNSLKLKSASSQDESSAGDKKLDQVKKLLDQVSLLTNSGSPITNFMQLPPIGDELPLGCLVEFDTETSHSTSTSPIWFNVSTKSSSKLPTIALESEVVRPESSIAPRLQTLLEPRSVSRPIVGVDQFLSDANTAVRSGNKGTLVYGTRVSGKTSVLREVQSRLKEDFVHTIWFPCAVHAEKQVHSLKETLRKLFLEAAWYSPSVIILDDLDKLIPAEIEHADATKTRQLAEVFKLLTESTVSVRNVSILASSVTKESLHSSLITNHIFEEILHLKSPDKYVRETILNQAVASLGLVKDPSFDILEVAGSTEGYQPGDLWTLVERANHETLFERIEAGHYGTVAENGSANGSDAPGSTINQSHFDDAMKDFVPSSLRGVKLQKSSVSWSEIGGLRETKKVILETLEWPTRYAPIFANCPLRLRSGLLLYGYPGCGKTLLASAVAAQCGLNFISIKGPEILNKYIGASEQSVRDLFDRAQAAKPCILFFDEFDSIAPKRGHDSTGVTDRVVNQMLTQMDGAEGLDGVYVLAATSRPDLIDSALLRPGRLDKSLICDMPDLEDRLDILRAVQGDMKLSEDVDLQSVAEQTSGYSGADLQALLYNAYMEAIHEVVDVDLNLDDNSATANGSADSNTLAKTIDFFEIDPTSPATNGNAVTSRHDASKRAEMSKKLEVIMGSTEVNASQTKDIAASGASSKASNNVVILPRHIAKSLAETSPSISLKERNKLGAIYHQFVSGRSGEMPSGTPSTDIGGRATLM
ncbi:AAA family ATPase peroxin 1 [Sugiyamaella lignohabitans]|uniref:Peroxisomal ATPase PEX1 n=1 Tax=Sugiyamaella lignohabitans TaxID=796027 RepID=A0A161HJ02_9ASCO|nr:AAA family ATPase peroxin 1 [Sugiyamaella lignohabitans]ANB12607.1 AAA family ATPase peroxin 1 [Sugiyamaella lignohabitans]